MKADMKTLEVVAAKGRLLGLDMVYDCASGHLGGSFSAMDALAVLYFDVMNVDPQNPANPDRDRFVLSKGHTAPALYATLAERGYFDTAELKKLLDEGMPAFGMGMGHGLAALAAGAQVEKMKCGHHGANQPAKDLLSGRTYVTSQNHCYVVTDPGCGTVRFVNANDATCEGVVYDEQKAFGVQFTPDAPRGLADASFLYESFAELMKGGAN